MSTIASLDELIEYEGSKWEDYDPSRPIIDMMRIIKFQRGVGDQANASGQYKLAFSHYSRARYVLSALRDHPGYGRLAPEDIADIYEHTDYLDEVLRTVIFVPQSGSGNVWAKAPGSDQWGLGEGERSLPRETPRVGDNNYDLRLGYRQVVQASPPTLLHRQDSRSRASQRYFQASPDSNSSHGHEGLGYDRAASHNHWMDESAEQKSTTGYPPASFRQVGADGTSHNSDYLVSLASSVAQLNIGASSPIPPSTLVAPQPQSFYTYNSQGNRVLGSRASSKGPPRADHGHSDIARPSTTSGNYHQGPYADNRARSSQSNSAQDYHTAPMSRIQVDNLSRERAEPAVQWPLDPTYAGDLEPTHYDTYRGPGGNYNPENSGSYGARARNLSVGNLARIVPQPSTLIESNERYPSSSRAHPARKRSLSDSGNYHMDPNISVDSMDYYTANAEFLTGFRQVATATLTRELGYDHPETIDSLELDAIDQMEQTNWRKAETLLTDVLDRRRQTQGNSHLLTIQSMSNLGWAYQGQGKLEDAVAIFNTALNELRKHNSETNWRIISDIQNRLKITRDKQGDRRDFAYSNRTADKTSTDMAAASGTNSLRRLGLQPMISSATVSVNF
ncbi:unnamed protein product [Rhizoctonia solani]|uniref:Uncharacterized protein n=1 Tax=Rhizoctonia solani TaxID=456999 RepID=A0A8H3ASP0_9AGAM|nr:unnamed protein product [Rhizoctonia solani]